MNFLIVHGRKGKFWSFSTNIKDYNVPNTYQSYHEHNKNQLLMQTLSNTNTYNESRDYYVMIMWLYYTLLSQDPMATVLVLGNTAILDKG